jgi:hypothetical protein
MEKRREEEKVTILENEPPATSNELHHQLFASKATK